MNNTQWTLLDGYDSLEELEEEWRDEDVWQHDLSAITERVRAAAVSDQAPARARDTLVTWLAAVERHWREHPAYADLRDTLLKQLASVQETEEHRVAKSRAQTRQLLAARAWADRQIGELRLREL